MYITKELHDAICEAGLYGIGVMLICFGAALLLPRVLRAAMRIRKRLKLWIEYRREVYLIRRDLRRYKAAMRVFDKPVRWKEEARNVED